MSDQGLLFDAPLVPRAPPGTYLSPSGADLKGPLIVVCEGCLTDASWNPGTRCPTPEAHTWKDPGMDPEEGDGDVEETMEITPRLADEIAAQVDVVLALAGEGGDDPKALRAAIDAELGQGDFAAWPVKRGEQVHFVEQLASVVLERLGKGVQEPTKRRPSTVTEGFDVETGNDIIRTPIGN